MRFFNNFARPGDFEMNLLELCPALEHLFIEFSSAGALHWRYDWAELTDALAKHCPSLHTLELSHPDCLDNTGEEELSDRYLGYDTDGQFPRRHLNVKELSGLKELTCSRFALLGKHWPEPDDEWGRPKHGEVIPGPLSEVLPENLKHLTLHTPESEPSEKDFAVFKDSLAETLESLTVETCKRTTVNKDTWEAYSEECERRRHRIRLARDVEELIIEEEMRRAGIGTRLSSGCSHDLPVYAPPWKGFTPAMSEKLAQWKKAGGDQVDAAPLDKRAQLSKEITAELQSFTRSTKQSRAWATAWAKGASR